MHYNGCNYLSMLGLKLNHVSKRGPSTCEDLVFALLSAQTVFNAYLPYDMAEYHSHFENRRDMEAFISTFHQHFTDIIHIVYFDKCINCWQRAILCVSLAGCLNSTGHDDVIKWKHFPRYWPFVRVTGHRWIPLTKASDTELWCFLSSAPE